MISFTSIIYIHYIIEAAFRSSVITSISFDASASRMTAEMGFMQQPLYES